MNNLTIFGVLVNTYWVRTWTWPEQPVTQSHWFRIRSKKENSFYTSKCAPDTFPCFVWNAMVQWCWTKHFAAL